MSVQIQNHYGGPTTTTTTFAHSNHTSATTAAGVLNNNNKMSTHARPNRLPLQPRNPNTFPTAATTVTTSKQQQQQQQQQQPMCSSSNGGDSQLSALESSNNENNKARFLSASSRKNSGSSMTMMSGGYPVEIGSEQDSSLVTHTGTGAAPNPKMVKRQASNGSAGSGKNHANPSATRAPPPMTSSSRQTSNNNDQDIVIEEKRKRIHGDGYTMHRYLRGRMLGKGGFAKVYLCTALDTNKQYAVKVVPKANLVKTRARQKLQAEIKIHRTLKHRRVCEYKHFFEDRTNCYILLELCHSQSMNELIKRRKRLTEPESAFFMSQLIEAVEYMHEQCVIHRDLKLGNLFLDRNLNVKVGDLGLATRLATAEEKRQTICGTPNYIAPEVIQGTKETRGHSFEVDIWSMGVILFTILVGKPPYEAKDVKATYQRIIANEYSFPNSVQISEVAKELIISMLQSNPFDRPTLSEMRSHPFFLMKIPKSLPNSCMHIAPEWILDDYGELAVVGQELANASGYSKNRSSRAPFGAKDPNAVVPGALATAKVEKREREVREAMHERVRATLSSGGSVTPSAIAPSSAAPFSIYDETVETKMVPLKTPKTSAMADIISGASAMALSEGRSQSAPSPSATDFAMMDDTEILANMLESLTTALDVAEQRKYSYSQSTMVRPTSRGGPSTWVTRYVDYTSKYGLGFLLNEGSSGVYFNDSTKAVLEAEGDTFQYVERRKVETSPGVVKKNEPVCETLSLADYPESLQKKVTLLKHFRNYLIEQQKKSDDDLGSVLGNVNAAARTSPMTYLKKWARTKHAILFRLSDQTVQIVFYDQTEVLLTPDKRFVTYVDKKRHRSTYYLNDELVGTNAEMAKRLKYAKEVLSQLLNGQPTKR